LKFARTIGAALAAVVLAAAPAWADMTDHDGPGEPPKPFEDLKPSERPAPSSDEAGLWMLADRAEQQIKTSGAVVRDPAINAYVRGVVCKLAGPYCGDIRVYVVRHADYNASMMPNGVMTVWTGLFLRTTNEAQLAAVLGHEIGHYVRRHAVQRQRDLIDKAGANMIVGSMLGAAGIPAGPLVTLALIGSVYSYSRDNEREADEVGARLMAGAGYDVREAAALWTNIVAERKDDDEEKSKSVFFATHPEPEERQAKLEALAKELNPAEPVRHEPEFRAVFALHLLGYLRDELNLRHYVKFGNLLDRIENENPAPGEIKFMRGEMYRLRAKEGDDKKALESYTAAEGLHGAPHELLRSLGVVQSHLGDKAAARESYGKYLELEPDAEDREVIRVMIKQDE